MGCKVVRISLYSNLQGEASDLNAFEGIERAAKLICTTPELHDLAAEVGLGSYHNGVTDPSDRAQLRAELDGMIAQIYNLTEPEFAHILSTFPIVPESVKVSVLNAYREVERELIP
ncbi:MAG: hypothetical protein AB4042_12785 [Leptolyngbyaceae cyanobacterium]